MQLNRRTDWTMFLFEESHSLDNHLDHWEYFARLDLPEIPVVGMLYWLGNGKDKPFQHYRVLWVAPGPQHFGVEWR